MQAVWHIFTNKNEGRKKFQIQLGIDVMTYTISKEWDGKSEHPSGIRAGTLVSCECKKCYFCLHGHMTTTTHRTAKKRFKMVHNKSRMAEFRTETCTEKRLSKNA